MPVSRWFRRGAWLGALVLTASLTSVAVPSQAATWDLDLNMRGPISYYFSPDGDGIRDRAVGFYRLGGRADVQLQVRRKSGVVATIGLGRMPAGSKRLRWNGKDGDGHVLPDGFYWLRIVAHPPGGAPMRGDWVQVGLDTSIVPGHIRLLESAVYPQTPDVVDGLWFRYDAPITDGSDWARVRGRVKDRSGKIIDRLGSEDVDGWFCDTDGDGTTSCDNRWNWTARHDGQALPPGIYRLQMIRHDRAGNRTQTGKWVRVSAGSLVTVEKSVTVSAEESGTWCNGLQSCGEFTSCGEVVVPGRFGVGSLGYRSAQGDQDCIDVASARHSVDFDHDVAAFGDFRVTAYGGPTVPGDPDQGELVVLSPDLPLTSTGTDTSDHETTSPWRAINRREFGVRPSITWSFRTRGSDNYDVAWFRVDYVVYQPPS